MSAPEGLRVLFLARSYPNNVFDTLGLWTAWLARELAKRHEVRVISPVPWCPPLPQLERLRPYTRFRAVVPEETRDGIRVYHPRFLVGPGSTAPCIEHVTYERSLRGLVGRVRAEFPFDLVHGHFVYPDGVVASRLARRYGVPFVVTDQAPWIPWLERSCIRRRAVAAAHDAGALTCVSGYIRRTMHHFLGSETPVHVIPNGVDSTTFAPGEAETRDRNRIAYVGLINFNKGIDTLLQAMTRVVERNPRSRLVLVGGAYYRDTALQEIRLKSLATELGLDGHVTFAGRLPPAEVARTMRESAVLVLPSRAETFGAVIVESLASGTPVVVTASGGPQEIVSDEVGRVVPVGDPEGLADALVDVMSRPEQFDPMFLRRHAVERYGWNVVAERYEQVYRSVLDEAA